MSKGGVADWLPYVDTRTVPTRQGWPISVLKMKDGTLCTALRLSQLDTFSMSENQVNQISACFVDALHVLPPQVYIQTVFETGDDYEALIEDFASRSAPDSHPLLKRGRQVRAEQCRANSSGRKPRITYWLGWRGVLATKTSRFNQVVKGFQKPDQARFVHASQVLADILLGFTSRLEVAGLYADPLSEGEIIDDLHRAVNPAIYKQTAAPFYVRSQEDLREHEGRALMLLDKRNLSSRLASVNMSITDTTLRFYNPDWMHRVLGVTQYPSYTFPGLLDPVMYREDAAQPFRLIVTHLASNKTLASEELAKRNKHLFGHMGERLFPPEDLKEASASHMRIVQELGSTGARAFFTSVQVVLTGKDFYELDTATRSVEQSLQDNNVTVATRVGEQLQAWQASLPGNGYTLWREPLNRTHQLLSRNAAHIMPHWLPARGEKEPDVLVQTRQRTWRGFNVRLLPTREDGSGLICGKTGSGKTFLYTLLLKLGVLDVGGYSITTDVKGPERSSYKAVCQILDGQYLSIDSNNSCSFNPCPTFEEVFEGGTYNEGVVLTLLRQLCMMGVPDYENNQDVDFFFEVARNVVKIAYEERRRDTSEGLMLEDIVNAFQRYTAPETDTLSLIAPNMRDRLLMWCRREDRSRLLNRRDAMNMTNRCTVMDFSGVENDELLSNVLMSSFSHRIKYTLNKLPPSMVKMVAVDEAKILFNKSKIAALIFEDLLRISRAAGAFCYILTQHFSDIANTPMGQAIKGNVAMYYLMRHAAGHAQVADSLELTDKEAQLFRSLQFKGGHYAECLVKDINQGLTEVIRYSPTPFDLWCDTSRGVDVEYRNKYQEDTGSTLLETVEELARQFPNGLKKSQQEIAENDFEGGGEAEQAAA